MSERPSEWINEWFNSPYYHILYKHRDFDEAALFIKELSRFFGFQKGQNALDTGCGRGRHSIYLNQEGLNVTGIDISPENIRYASGFKKEGLEFLIHDMRELIEENKFDYIFNLFTSFGYFDKEEDNYNTIFSFSKELKSGGKMVIDFLNPWKLTMGLVPSEEKEIEGINFKISREISGNFIIKNIQIREGNKSSKYQEKVMLINKNDFIKYFNFANLKIDQIFGNYRLEEFREDTSERMIFIVSK
jgi:SAM-dependent methyltransferase